MIRFIDSSMALVVLVFLLFFSIAFGETNATKEVTIKGQIADPVCLVTMNMKGEGNRKSLL